MDIKMNRIVGRVPVRVVVSGRHGFFNGSESRTRGVSLPLPPPSAAKGELESVLFYPKYAAYIITRETILHPVVWFPEARNVPNPDERKSGGRTQIRRQVLQDPAFLIDADLYIFNS